jgi:phosphate ABC transporter phosphate-binding protein
MIMRAYLGRSVASLTLMRLAFCCVLAGSALAAQAPGGAQRLYVATFTTKTGADQLQKDVTSELRKLNSVSIVANESNADLILDGGGEIWIKGYRSFSSHTHEKLPTNGMPIYGGFLSVELKNKSGASLWSYLVTPSGDSLDVAKDLSRRIAMQLADALERVETRSSTEPLPQPTTILNGAGATFPEPVYSKWFASYRRDNPKVQIDYHPIGSEAGVRRLLAGTVDFGASDSPEAIHDIAPNEEGKYLFLPSVVGAVVPIVNLPLAGDIAFTPEALSGIFLGKIKKWNDPVLKQANRRLQLPDLEIVVVHRADGSGTSYAWTDYLSRTNPAWKSEVGASLAPKWPVGRAAAGNDGVANTVKEFGGSIGYVEFIYALQHHLSFGKVRNRNGEFVGASLESIAAAVHREMEIPDDFKLSIVDAPGHGAYPIASFTWFVVPTHIPDETKRNAMTFFLRWMIGPGQLQAGALGYLPLPGTLQAKEEQAISRIN